MGSTSSFLPTAISYYKASGPLKAALAWPSGSGQDQKIICNQFCNEKLDLITSFLHVDERRGHSPLTFCGGRQRMK
jgi:hypothetical protein